MSYGDRVEPLFPAEPVEMIWEDLKAITVGQFDSWAREDIWKGFELFCLELSRLGLTADIYVDGSFVTWQKNPSDIDFTVVVRMPPSNYQIEQRVGLTRLSHDRDHWKRRHRCDFLLLVEHASGPNLLRTIDQQLNWYAYNEFGLPKRSVLLRLPR